MFLGMFVLGLRVGVVLCCVSIMISRVVVMMSSVVDIVVILFVMFRLFVSRLMRRLLFV